MGPFGPRAGRLRCREWLKNGWRIRNSTDIERMLEKDFTEVIIAERARFSCSAAVERTETERIVRGLSESRCFLLRLFADDALFKCKTWLNKYATLHKLHVGPIKMRDMYRCYATMFSSHCIGFSSSKTVQILSDSGLKCGELSTIRFINYEIMAFSATGRGDLLSPPTCCSKPSRHSTLERPERQDAIFCAA